ncbi:MAG: molybdenum cofactor biosynthesis protein MoaE [Candidatus Sphingomonas colombiensis]|nr:molybdenum cofactor biosynthesis protein MoaE [Sphingomonas sp.]WEK42538.1 MAG: molybdenum cofactor biosynthesis protein MoaE [Sphingomonas sp.]
MIFIRVSHEPIDIASEHARVERGGAVATFTGLVRADDGVEELTLEHYPAATEAALTRLADEAAARWSLSAASIVHRVGAMRPGERIVFVGTCAAHRAAALEACAFLIDRLKTDAPFWKRERRGAEARWVDQREGDHRAAEKWSR